MDRFSKGRSPQISQSNENRLRIKNKSNGKFSAWLNARGYEQDDVENYHLPSIYDPVTN